MPLMACPQCGQNVSSLASVCPQCSYSLREQRLKEGQIGPQITCRKCGQLISAKANVCPHCGIDLRTACPSCGRDTQTDWRTCPYCRTELPSGTEQQQLPAAPDQGDGDRQQHAIRALGPGNHNPA